MCVGGSLWEVSCTCAVVFFSYSGGRLLLLLVLSCTLLLSSSGHFRLIGVGPASGGLLGPSLFLLRGRPSKSGAVVRVPYPECPGESTPVNEWLPGL